MAFSAAHSDGHRRLFTEVDYPREFPPRLIERKRQEPVPSVTNDSPLKAKISGRWYCDFHNGFLDRFWCGYSNEFSVVLFTFGQAACRSEERRVGKECRSRWLRCTERRR